MLGVINGKIRSSRTPQGQKAVSAHVSRGHNLIASSGASPNGLGAGPQGGVPSLSVGVNWPSQYQYYFTGILPAEPIINDPSSLALFWRDIYLHDAVGGTMVDLQMEFPFSDFILQGVKDKKILQTYIDGVAQLNMREMFPVISWAHLVDGYFCGTLIYDPKTRRFADTMVHDALQTSVRTTPFFNRDPAITVSVSNAVAQFLSTNSDYNREYIESLPEHFQAMLEEGRYDLNPVTTLFVPRRSLTDRSYESYFRRLLPMYLIEKTLYRGTLVEAQRRQRAMTHLTVGTQDWTPNPAELLNTVQNFQAAEADPLGGWIVTREGVSANDLRPGGDFWRWMDTADALVPYKLRALGASESFLGGDATFDNQATSYSMFLEGMSAYRQKLTTRIFYHRVFPMIAIINGFYKDKTHRNKSLSDYFYNATDRENLITPSVHWKKNLDVVDDTGTFDMLERASEHGVPVTLRRYIVAAGMDPESIISEMEQDADLRRKVEELTGKSATHESLEEDDYGLEASTWFKPTRRLEGPRMPTMPVNKMGQYKVPLLARDFGNSAEPHNLSRTGKKKAVPSMLHPERRQKENEQILKVSRAMRDPNFRREMALRNKKRFGTSKHDLGSKM